MSTRLTLRLTPLHVKTIDWLMSGDDAYRPDDRHRRDALEQLILDHANVVRERADRNDAQANPGRGDTVLHTIDRLKKSRDRYRDLAVRVEAALLGLPPREDFHGLERRLERALAGKGCNLRPRPRPDRAVRQGGGKGKRRA